MEFSHSAWQVCGVRAWRLDMPFSRGLCRQANTSVLAQGARQRDVFIRNLSEIAIN